MAVIVWEWFNEFCQWMPYEPHVVLFIEEQKNQAQHLYLGQADPVLSKYALNLQTEEQIRTTTDTSRPIRRRVYPASSSVSKGILWKWRSDHGQWHSYGIDTASLLEDAYSKKKSMLDLAKTPVHLPYSVDFKSMRQSRNESGTIRQVQRSQLGKAYPTEIVTNGSSSQTSSKGKKNVHSLDSGSTDSDSCTSSSTTKPKKKVNKKKHVSDTGEGAANGQAGSSSSGSSLTGSYSLKSGAACLNPVITAVTTTLISAVVPSVTSSLAMFHSTNVSKSDTSRGSKKKTKLKNSSFKTSSSSAETILSKYVSKIDNPPDEDCCICCDKLTQASDYDEEHGHGTVWKLDKCSHMFHGSCLHAMYESGPKNGHIQCPNCKTIYGEKYGNCPKGTMDHRVIPNSLPGYLDCGTIQICYNISSGMQGPDQPHPGKRFRVRGFPRVCFLPDNEKGREVLRLLKIAWERRLTFTISTSVTTGESDTVTWNEIHHKTEFGSNATGHGYPDPNYLDNVLMELAVHGITKDS